MTPVFFQSIGYSKTSTFLSVLRQLICLVPLFWIFSFIGLDYAWLGIPFDRDNYRIYRYGDVHYAIKVSSDFLSVI